MKMIKNVETVREIHSSKIRKEIGITLVGLVVTIILLLMLAGITISKLSGSGLFKNAKFAEEKSKNAQEKEEGILAEYENKIGEYVDGSRDTVTLTTEQYNNIMTRLTNLENNQTSSTNPTGTIIAYSVDSVPEGYLKCEGQELSRTEYKKLFDVIGTSYGVGDGSTTFNVPDLRGEFLRGSGTNSHTNQGNGTTVGKHQDATAHTRTWTSYEDKRMQFYTTNNETYPEDAIYKDSLLGADGIGYKLDIQGAQKSYKVIGDAGVLYTTRPTNTSVLYCIKY